MFIEIGPHTPDGVTGVRTSAQGPIDTLGQSYFFVSPDTPGRKKIVKYVQFKDAVTYVAGHATVWSDLDFETVTNDYSLGLFFTARVIAAGCTFAVPAQNGYGYIQIRGEMTGVRATTGVLAGEPAIVDISADGFVVGFEDSILSVASAAVLADDMEDTHSRVIGIAMTAEAANIATVYICPNVRAE